MRARGTGYLLETPFKEGSEVKKGDLLFVIDPRPYQAELDKAQALLAASEARLKRAEGDFQRAKGLHDANPPVIGAGELNRIATEREEAQAGVRAARAGLDIARLNLDFTRVTSPLDGRIGRRLIDPGNLVKADETLLARIVSDDPLYAYFDMDEKTLLGLRKATNEGKPSMPRDGSLPVLMGLSGEEGYPHKGTLNFVSNQVNPAGTLTLRAVFANPRPAGGERLLTPGMFARLRLPLGSPHKALLVPDAAIGTDEGLKYVYVIDADNKVQYRRVTTGSLQAGGLRVIAEGLHPDDRVAVGKLKDLRPRMEVQPVMVVVPAETPGKPPEQGKK